MSKQTKSTQSISAKTTPSKKKTASPKWPELHVWGSVIVKKRLLRSFSLGESDLVAIPMSKRPNSHNKRMRSHWYSVADARWLQTQVNRGAGLHSHPDSTARESDPRFVEENGESIPRKVIYSSYKLKPCQLKRIKPCKRAVPEGGRTVVDHFNVCDVEALVEQGSKLAIIYENRLSVVGRLRFARQR